MRRRFGSRPGGAFRDVLLTTVVMAVIASCFTNPVRPNAPDPTIAWWQGNYYLTATEVNRVGIVKSPTIAGLATAPSIEIPTNPDPSRCCNIWSGDLKRLNGPNGWRWYLYYSASTADSIDDELDFDSCAMGA
jgi:GH43 family beta-xylosidase